MQHVVLASFELEMRGTATRTWSRNNMQYIVLASVGLEMGHSYEVCCVPKRHIENMLIYQYKINKIISVAKRICYTLFWWLKTRAHSYKIYYITKNALKTHQDMSNNNNKMTKTIPGTLFWWSKMRVYVLWFLFFSSFPFTPEQYTTLLHGSSSFLLPFVSILVTCCAPWVLLALFIFSFVSFNAWTIHAVRAMTSCLLSPLYISE